MAGLYNFRQGDTFSLSGTFSATVSGATVTDFTGYTGAAALRTHDGDLVNNLTFTWVNAATGVGTVSYSDTSNWPLGVLLIDVTLTSGDGNVVSSPSTRIKVRKSGGSGGSLKIATALSSSVTAVLAPWFKGDKGDKGDDGDAGEASISDGDKGDITTSSSGAVWTIDNGAVTLAKMADMATASLLGRSTAGTGSPEVLSASAARTLLNVEDGATADQTGAEIKTAYEAEADTNAFTDADHTKLDGIETAATADQSDAEIETAYNNQVSQVSGGEKTAGTETAVRRFAPQDIHDMIDTHAPGGGGGGDAWGDAVDADIVPDADGTRDLGATGTRFAETYTDALAVTNNITVGGTVDGRDVATDGTKLDGIESNATADQTGAEIKAAYEAEANAFTDAQFTKLAGIETGATADQTGAEIKTAYEGEADTNAFTDADHSKLDGIEAGADVTDTTNVTAAGALMDSELTDIAAVKALDQGVATTDSPQFAGVNVGHASDTTITRVSAGVIAVEGNTVLLGTNLGVTVQPYDADTLKADTADVLTAGFATTAHGDGTKSSGTYTPDEADGNIQHVTNGGAHTLAPMTNNGTVVVHYTNNGSAGAITTSGFTLVDGDAFDTTNTNEFLCFLTKANDVSCLTVKALQ